MDSKKIKIIGSIMAGMITILMGIMIILIIKIDHLEEKVQVTVETKVGSEPLDQYLEERYIKKDGTIDPQWKNWEDVRYYYGFDKNKQPIYQTVHGVLESDTMLSVKGGNGRWNHKFVSGGHVFEGWSGKNLSRLTMLMGKFHETFACIQTYSPAGLYEENRRFGWIKLGSDEKKKGVDVSQGWTTFYTPLTLQARKEAPKRVTDSDLNPQLQSAKVPVGTMYYDTTLQQVRVMTDSGWKGLAFCE